MSTTDLSIVTIDPASSVPPYEQIRSAIAALIVTGQLIAGTRLPPVRALADQLTVAANTVARSYRELEAAGLVETRGRGGTVVSSQGDHARARLVEAAIGYAQLARSLAIDTGEAERIVAAALAESRPPSA